MIDFSSRTEQEFEIVYFIFPITMKITDKYISLHAQTE